MASMVATNLFRYVNNILLSAIFKGDQIISGDWTPFGINDTQNISGHASYLVPKKKMTQDP